MTSPNVFHQGRFEEFESAMPPPLDEVILNETFSEEPVVVEIAAPMNTDLQIQGMQLAFVLLLLWMKYGASCCGLKMTGSHAKILGCLLFCQGLSFHNKVNYWAALYGDLKSIVDIMITSTFLTLAILHLTRANHFIPDSWKGETQVIAERLINRNQAELSL